VVVTHYFAPHVGGIETVAAEQITRLQQRGWEIELFTTRLHASDRPRSVRNRQPVRSDQRLRRQAGCAGAAREPGCLAALTRAAEHADVVVAHGHVYPTSV